MSANLRQVGGTHYKQNESTPQHWDLAILYNWDPFQYQITKYIMRWKSKHATLEKKIEDLEKAAHFLEKYIEAVKQGYGPTLTTKAQVFIPGEINPTGWTGFVFEGADATGYLFKCRLCKLQFYAAPNENPGTFHVCGAEPSRAYTGQD